MVAFYCIVRGRVLSARQCGLVCVEKIGDTSAMFWRLGGVESSPKCPRFLLTEFGRLPNMSPKFYSERREVIGSALVARFAGM
jgi:hypothetical protein